MNSTSKTSFYGTSFSNSDIPLFTNLSIDEQVYLCGGLYNAIAFPASTSVPTTSGPNLSAWVAQDAQGNHVTLNDLIAYLRRTVG